MPNNRREFLKKLTPGAGIAACSPYQKGQRLGFASARCPGHFLTGLGPTAKNEIGQYIPLATKNSMNFAAALQTLTTLRLQRLVS